VRCGRDAMIIDAPKFTLASTGAVQPQAAASASVAVQPAAVNAHKSEPSSSEDVRRVIAAASRATKALNNSVELSLDAKSGQPIVRVVDAETGQLIRQIPTEEIMELRRALDRIAGMLIHRTA